MMREKGREVMRVTHRSLSNELWSDCERQVGNSITGRRYHSRSGKNCVFESQGMRQRGRTDRGLHLKNRINVMPMPIKCMFETSSLIPSLLLEESRFGCLM